MLRVVVFVTLASAALVACDEGESVSENQPTATHGDASPDPKTAHYSNESLKVELDYPADWAPVSGYELGSEPGRFADPRGEAYGFFAVNALSGEGWTLDQAATNDAGHKLRPYGEHPQISTLDLPAGEARLITPDPTTANLQAAEVLIRHINPQIVPFYNFFILYAHVDYIEEIARSVRLVSR